jgi:outer membrane lipoprotein-sorting protein
MRICIKPLHALALLVLFLSACSAPREIRHVRSINPSPYINTLIERSSLAGGFATTMHMEFRGEGKNFQGKVYLIIAYHEMFRLEVPGWMGSTLLVMVNNGKNVWAYYPEEGTSYRSSAHGLSISPYLPFPLPIDPALIPLLITGALPDDVEYWSSRAYELESGRTVLYLEKPGEETLRYIFSRGEKPHLVELQADVHNGTFILTNSQDTPNLPTEFRYRSTKGELKAKLKDSRPLDDVSPDTFQSPIPPGIPMRDLEILR